MQTLSTTPSAPQPRGWARVRGLVSTLCLAVVLLAGFSACTVQVGQAYQVKPGSGVTTPVRVVRDGQGGTVVLIDVLIGGRGPYTFVLDTGAEVSLIDQSLADQLGLRHVGDPHEVSGIGGTQQAIPVAIRRWQSGGIVFPDTTIDSGDFSSQRSSAGYVGLLGSDILSQFDIVTIDYTHRTLTVAHKI